jgi:small nuclear ribonucleoprotein (snRNP)-like protein
MNKSQREVPPPGSAVEASSTSSEGSRREKEKEKGRKDKKRLRKKQTLTVLVEAMEGMQTKVELKNNSVVEGRLDRVEGNMSVFITRATQVNADGSILHMNLAFIPGRAIRYIHIDDRINIEVNLRRHITRMANVVGSKYKRNYLKPAVSKPDRVIVKPNGEDETTAKVKVGGD